MTETGFCQAVSQKGALLTVYAGGMLGVVVAKGGELICTLNPGHERSHSVCDGQGHVLARWPREPVERYWQPGGCAGHDHGGGH